MVSTNTSVDINNNEASFIGLHVTRAEMDLTAELKRLNMTNRPPTPGAPLKRSGKITNFPSQINFDEMDLGVNSTTDINGNIEPIRPKLIVNKQGCPIPSFESRLPNLIYRIQPRILETDLNSSYPDTAFLVSKNFVPRSKVINKIPRPPISVKTEISASAEPSLPPSDSSKRAKDKFWDMDTVPSFSDKSKGDGGASSFPSSDPPKTSDLGSFETFKTFGDSSSAKTKMAASSKMKSAAKAAESLAVAGTDPPPNIATYEATAPVTDVAEGGAATRAQSVDSEAVTNDSKSSSDKGSKASGDKSSSGSKSTSSSKTKSSKSTGKEGTGSSAQTTKSQKPSSVPQDDVVEVVQDCEGKKGAIMFKVPGRLTHKTTIKVSHFPQNGNSLTVPPSLSTGNAECIVEDIIPQQQNSQCPDPQAAAAMQMQQMMAYQQYCNRSMYCTPYGYYPYSAGC